MCHVVRVVGGGVAIVCGGQARSGRPCIYCGAAGRKLCDHRNSDGRTCDAPMCVACATTVPGRNRDYCRNHAPRHRAELQVSGTLPFEDATS